MNKMEIVYQLLLALLFILFRWLFGFVQGLLWMVTGINAARRRRNRPDAYANSAHVMTIWWRHKLSCVVLPNSLMDFITVHERFDQPDVVLEDNVTLYAITSSQAVFVETEKEVDAANSEFSSFMKIAQFVYAKKVIVLPIPVFHHLADQLGDPRGKLVFVGNTGRCGSTLLCQIYEETGRCVAFAEPDVINTLSQKHETMEPDLFRRLAISTVRMLCKLERGIQMLTSSNFAHLQWYVVS